MYLVVLVYIHLIHIRMYILSTATRKSSLISTSSTSTSNHIIYSLLAHTECNATASLKSGLWIDISYFGRTAELSWSEVCLWKPFTRPFESTGFLWSSPIGSNESIYYIRVDSNYFVRTSWSRFAHCFRGHFARQKYQNLDNYIEFTENNNRLGKLLHVSGLFYWYISNPGQGGATAQKIALRIFFYFWSTSHFKHTHFFFFAQIVITSSIHNALVHVGHFCDALDKRCHNSCSDDVSNWADVRILSFPW